MGIFSLKEDFFGLDIGTTSIKLVQLRSGQQKPSLVTYGTANIPIGFSMSDSEVDILRLAEIIKQLVKGTKATSKNVVTALSENHVFNLVVKIPQMPKSELAKAVRWQAERNLPIKMEDVKLDWQVISVPKNPSEPLLVMIVAAPIDKVRRISKIITASGLRLFALETSTVSASRSLATFPGARTMIVEIGAITTEISIVENHVLLYSRSVSIGGEYFTKSISRSLGLDEGQAETFKRKFGLSLDKLEGKVYEACKQTVANLEEEISRSMQFFAENFNAKIDMLIVSGGSAKMPELANHIAKTFNINTQIANPWKNVSYPMGVQDDILRNAPDYSVAIGLAMREDK